MILNHADGTQTFYLAVDPLGDQTTGQTTEQTRGNTLTQTDNSPLGQASGPSVASAQDSARTETLLLLHGLGADHMMWSPQIQPYTQAGFRLLLPDLFGHGQSSPIKHIELTDWHRQINDLLAHHNVETCTVLGVSMGGAIALSFAAAYPHKVNKLIVADTFCELRTWREKLLGATAVCGLSAFRWLGHKPFSQSLRATYKAPHTQAAQAYFEQVCAAAPFSQRLSQMVLARKAINRINVLNNLTQLPAPAMVLVGEEFGGFFINTNYKIAAALPCATFVILKKARDPSNLTNPVKFNQQVLKFLAAHPYANPDAHPGAQTTEQTAAQPPLPHAQTAPSQSSPALTASARHSH